MNMKTYRQGDILLVAIKSIPAPAVKQAPAGTIVLGEGEIAGHRHEILETEAVEAYKIAEGFYLSVEQETALVHPEHERIALAPGTYQVIRQMDFRRAELRRVQD